MRKPFKLVLKIAALVLLCAYSNVMFAQRTITGIVKDAKDGSALPGVNVTIKEVANIGTITNVEGRFSIGVPADAKTIVFSFIGYTAQEVVLNAQDSYEVLLQPSTQELEEVVVTALGIKREQKSLGYAVQEVKGDKLVEARELNFVNSLSGKVSGLQVLRSSNGPGGSSKIVLRGNNSLTGNNQPLIVVDGIPINNFTGATNTDFWNPSPDMGNGLSDINPDDIASMSVLKGASAAALYGNRAGNGVILITTKSGRKNVGLGVTISASLAVESLFLKPELQKKYGQGSYGTYDAKSGSSWGPKIEGQTVEIWDGSQQKLRYYDNFDEFFDLGINSTNSVTFSQEYGGTSIYSSLTRTDDNSMIPGAKLNRTTLMARATNKFGKSERLTLDTKVQYINTEANNRPLNGQRSENASLGIFSLPSTVDLSQFRDSRDEFGKMIWYNDNGINPYWLTKYNKNYDERDRFLLNASLRYKITDWLSAEFKAGSDIYTTRSNSKTYGGSPLTQTGRYSIGKDQFNESNYSAMITAQKDNLISKLGGLVTVGGNLMNQESSGISSSAGTLVVPNLFTVGNAQGNPTISESFSHRKTNSVFGTMQLNWDGYLFVDATFRNDWSSTLSKDNRSFFYPSASLSWVVTDMLKKMDVTLPAWIDFAKARFSVAQVGNDLPAYQLYNTYKIDKDPLGGTTAGTNNVLYDENVVNEKITSKELGADISMFDNRLRLDVAIYKSNATDQLIDLPMDPMSGYSSKKINAGDIQNKGIEIQASMTMVKMANSFTWDLGANFSSNKNEIKELADGVTKYGLGGYDNLQIIAEVGEKYGVIYGTKFARVEDKTSPYYGKLILKDGVPTSDGKKYNLGSQQANALLGISNAFSYKGFKLSMLFDMRFGGKMFSGTNFSLQQSGKAAVTVKSGGREDFVVDGVVLDNGSYVVNTQTTTVQDYYNKGLKSSGNLGITEANLYDATNIRLRNISLSYDFSKNLLKNIPFQSVRLTASCNNVWMLKSDLRGVDPESVYATSTNATGFENGSAPTLRTFTFNVTVGF